MGARCTLFGHVRDSTEFEERREERPSGTVLICREYQVCRRCGDREEMYRNEQLLAAESTEADARTTESTEADARTTETVDDTAPRENGSENRSENGSDNGSDTRRVGEHDERDAAPEPADEPDATGTRSLGATTTPTLDQSESDGDDRPENASKSESVEAGASSTAGPGHQAAPDTAGTERVTHDAVIIADSTTDADPSADERHRQARTDGTGDSLAAPDEGGSPTSSFEVGDDDGQIRCESCGREWRRDDTSLREGDLCPGCREAYVGEA